jgi:hypothetical protein
MRGSNTKFEMGPCNAGGSNKYGRNQCFRIRSESVTHLEIVCPPHSHSWACRPQSSTQALGTPIGSIDVSLSIEHGANLSCHLGHTTNQGCANAGWCNNIIEIARRVTCHTVSKIDSAPTCRVPPQRHQRACKSPAVDRIWVVVLAVTVMQHKTVVRGQFQNQNLTQILVRISARFRASRGFDPVQSAVFETRGLTRTVLSLSLAFWWCAQLSFFRHTYRTVSCDTSNAQTPMDVDLQQPKTTTQPIPGWVVLLFPEITYCDDRI